MGGAHEPVPAVAGVLATVRVIPEGREIRMRVNLTNLLLFVIFVVELVYVVHVW